MENFKTVSDLIQQENVSSIGFAADISSLPYSGNITLIVTDLTGKKYISKVYYDKETNQISPPKLIDDLSIKPSLEPSLKPSLEHLPPEVIIEIGITMDLKHLLNICRSNRNMSDILCYNKNFWRRKLQHEIGIERIEKIIKDYLYEDDLNYWKDRYKNYGKVYAFGNNGRGRSGLGDVILPTEIPVLISSLKNKRITSISASGHSLVLDANGMTYSFGPNTYGQLGLGDRKSRSEPELISSLNNIRITAVSSSGGHSLVLDEDGRVYSFGSNFLGQLGLGDNEMNESRYKPALITSLDKIKITFISAGTNFSLLLDEDGRAYSFGGNDYGQLGLGDNKGRNKPELILSLNKIKIIAISAGDFHSLVLDENGRAYSFGSNNHGELGLGDNNTETELKNRNIPELILFPEEIKIIAISAGNSNSLVLDYDGRVYSFGENWSGILGLGLGLGGRIEYRNKPEWISSLNGIIITAISAGNEFHSLVLDEDGIIYSFGDNLFGQLGLGNHGHGTERNRPEQILSLKNKRIKSISAGEYYSLIISF